MPKKLPKSITVIGRRWCDRYGNTCHTAQVIVDGESTVLPQKYGHGDHYADTTAFKWLIAEGVIPAPEHEREAHWRHIRDNLGITYSYTAMDVQRKKDLN